VIKTLKTSLAGKELFCYEGEELLHFFFYICCYEMLISVLKSFKNPAL